jgi:urea transporter
MDNEKVRNGQYGRNSVLIGPSIVDCFNFEFAFGTTSASASAPTSSRTWPILFFFSIVLSLVTLSVESIWIRESFQRRFRLWNTNTTTNTTTTLPSLLLPYNITLLIALLFAKVWNYTMSTQIEFQNHYHVSDDDDGGIDTNNNNNTRFIVYRAVLNGLSRIFFVDGIVTGILILIGVGLCSRIIAISLICGSFVSSFVLGFLVFEESYDYLNYGYAGFNPALCAAGIFFYFVPSYKLIGLSLIVAIISTVIVSGSIDVLLRIM